MAGWLTAFISCSLSEGASAAACARETWSTVWRLAERCEPRRGTEPAARVVHHASNLTLFHSRPLLFIVFFVCSQGSECVVPGAEFPGVGVLLRVVRRRAHGGEDGRHGRNHRVKVPRQANRNRERERKIDEERANDKVVTVACDWTTG